MSRLSEAVGVVCGMGAACTFLVAWGISAAGDPSYDPLTSWLSDLGVGPEADVFNGGLMLTGALVIPFAVLAMRPVLGRGVSARLAVPMLCAVGVLAALLGVYTEDSADAHMRLSGALFSMLVLTGAAMWWALQSGHPLGQTATRLTLGTTVLGLMLAVFASSPNEAVSPLAELLFFLSLMPWWLVVMVELVTRRLLPPPAPLQKSELPPGL